jgi:hypothetical protein
MDLSWVATTLAGYNRDYGADIRLDSRKSQDRAVEVQRIAVRAWANQMVAGIKADPDTRLDAAGVKRLTLDLAAAVADGLGMRARGEEVVRMDSAYAPMEHVARGNLVLQAPPSTAWQDAIGIRSVPMWSISATIRTGAHSGRMALHTPGSTDLPQADFAQGERQRPILTFKAGTSMTFEEVGRDPGSLVNLAQEKAAAARLAYLRTREAILITSPAGVGEFGLDSLPVNTIVSTVDYSTATIAVMYEDMLRIVQGLRSAADDTQAGGSDTLLIGTDWLDALARTSNLAAGGSMTGTELVGQLMASDLGFAQTFQRARISRVIPVPALNGYGGADRAAAVLVDSTDADGGLREVLATPIVPVRRSSDLSADHTLWVYRTGGLEWVRSQKQGIAAAKVR